MGSYFDHPTLFADALSLVNDGEHCWFGSLNEGVKKLSPLPIKRLQFLSVLKEAGQRRRKISLEKKVCHFSD